MGTSDVFSLVASLLAVAITGLIGWATHKSAQKAAERNVNTQSRTDIEKEAFERAKGYYTDTIDRQQAEIQGLERDVQELKAERGRDRARYEAQKREHDHDVEVLRRDLTRCQALLRAKFPDDDPELYKPQT